MTAKRKAKRVRRNPKAVRPAEPSQGYELSYPVCSEHGEWCDPAACSEPIHYPRRICEIPACGCTGEAHP